MISIIRAKEKDSQLLSGIGKTSFIESHGNSAAAAEINSYLDEKFNDEVLKEELSDPKNIYHIIYHDDQPAGYSKIIFNVPHSTIQIKNITKLERFYLLRAFYNLNLGLELLRYNIELSKKNNQAGMWLFVWRENHRAVRFYKKNGFIVIGSYDFKLTETHSNPNYQMFLSYS
ncbi:MAG: GNAT family N-acetyltransferase [Chitinophagales bacterium]